MTFTGFEGGYNNVASLLFILISWGAIIIGILKSKNLKRSSGMIYGFVSFSAALFALLFQTLDIASLVVKKDFSALMDLTPYMTKAYLLFVVVTIVLNGLLLKRLKDK